MKNLYDVLEVSKTASPEVIKGAFKYLSQKWHPDKNGGSEFSLRKISEINEAYQVLGDAVKKKAYDESLSKFVDESRGIKSHPAEKVHRSVDRLEDVSEIKKSAIQSMALRNFLFGFFAMGFLGNLAFWVASALICTLFESFLHIKDLSERIFRVAPWFVIVVPVSLWICFQCGKWWMVRGERYATVSNELQKDMEASEFGRAPSWTVRLILLAGIILLIAFDWIKKH